MKLTVDRKLARVWSVGYSGTRGSFGGLTELTASVEYRY